MMLKLAKAALAASTRSSLAWIYEKSLSSNECFKSLDSGASFSMMFWCSLLALFISSLALLTSFFSRWKPNGQTFYAGVSLLIGHLSASPTMTFFSETGIFFFLLKA